MQKNKTSRNLQKYIIKIKKYGYAVVPNLISRKQCNKFINLLESDYEKYSKLYSKPEGIKKHDLANKSYEKVVFNLHNKNYSWFKIFKNKIVLQILDFFLKEGSFNGNEPYYLNNISARTPTKGSPGQIFHIDGGLPGTNYTLKVNVLWCLNDFTKENGYTRVIPKSHKIRSFPKNNKDCINTKQLYAKAGSAIIFDGALWHSGSGKKNDLMRWAIVLGYARWWIKPSFDFMKNTPKNIFKKLDDEDKRILGFNLAPPKDEFTRLRRIASFYESPLPYKLPASNS